jgi:hypothetical protein
VVVVAVRGVKKVGNLGGVVLYIVAEPLAQLTSPEMDVYRGSKLNQVGVYRGLETRLKVRSGDHTRSRRQTKP